MRVVIVNTFDTEAVLQDFLQTVRAWEAGRPHVPITLRVDTPQLSPCPCEQGAYDVPAARPVSRGSAAEQRPERGPVSKAQWHLQRHLMGRRRPATGWRDAAGGFSVPPPRPACRRCHLTQARRCAKRRRLAVANRGGGSPLAGSPWPGMAADDPERTEKPRSRRCVCALPRRPTRWGSASVP